MDTSKIAKLTIKSLVLEDQIQLKCEVWKIAEGYLEQLSEKNEGDERWDRCNTRDVISRWNNIDFFLYKIKIWFLRSLVLTFFFWPPYRRFRWVATSTLFVIPWIIVLQMSHTSATTCTRARVRLSATDIHAHDPHVASKRRGGGGTPNYFRFAYRVNIYSDFVITCTRK